MNTLSHIKRIREYEQSLVKKVPKTRELHFSDEHRAKLRLAYKNHQKKGSLHPLWKGKKRTTTKGYIQIYNPNHPHCNQSGFVLEHRLVVESIIGRFLHPHEHIHHRNAIKSDNRPENLAIVTLLTHYGEVQCPYCGKDFLIH